MSRIKYNCDYCGKESSDKASHYKRTVRHYCGQQCYWDDRKENWKPEEQPTWKGGGMSAEDKALRVKARSDINHAIRDGKVERMPCLACGEEKSEAHHYDYNKPLEVEWFCKKHHEMLHHDNPELLQVQP